VARSLLDRWSWNSRDATSLPDTQTGIVNHCHGRDDPERFLKSRVYAKLLNGLILKRYQTFTGRRMRG
jgi:hypothetical protein